MIAIVNRGQTNKPGVFLYSLQINERAVCYFEHVRSEPLSVCLRKAAEAAERHEKELFEFLLGSSF